MNAPPPAYTPSGGAAASVTSGAAAASASSGLASEFRNGRIVVLKSAASGKSLRCADAKGAVEGLGAEGEFAQVQTTNHFDFSISVARPLLPSSSLACSIHIDSDFFWVFDWRISVDGSFGVGWCNAAREITKR